MIRNRDHQNHRLTVYLYQEKYTGCGSIEIEPDLWDRLKIYFDRLPMQRFHRSRYRHRNLELEIKDHRYRRYSIEFPVVSELDRGFIAMVDRVEQIERVEFPVIDKYDEEYEEEVFEYRNGPISIELIDRAGVKTVRLSTKLLPDREEYIDGRLARVLGGIAKTIRSSQSEN